MNRMLVGLFILLSVNSVFAQPSGYFQEKTKESKLLENKPIDPVEAKDILEKSKTAQKRITRVQSDSMQEIDIKQGLHAKIEKIFDIDYSQKVMHEVTRIKDWVFNMSSFQRAYLDKKILQAEEKGVPPEKIRQMREHFNKLISATEGMLERASKNMKGSEYEVFYVDQSMYLRFKDKWGRMELPFLKTLWEVYSEFQEGNMDKENFLLAFRDLPEKNKKLIESAITYLENVKHKDIRNINYVAQTLFQGTPCYGIDVKNTGLSDIMKESLLSYAQIKNDNEAMVKINSFSYKEFISKKNFLTLGEQVYFEMLFPSPEYSEPVTAFTGVVTKYNYPGGKIELPKELAQAIFVKDEEEMKKMFAPDMPEK